MTIIGIVVAIAAGAFVVVLLAVGAVGALLSSILAVGKRPRRQRPGITRLDD